MKGLIRKEWYSLWSQYRIHMLAMLGLGVLLFQNISLVLGS